MSRGWIVIGAQDCGCGELASDRAALLFLPHSSLRKSFFRKVLSLSVSSWLQQKSFLGHVQMATWQLPSAPHVHCVSPVGFNRSHSREKRGREKSRGTSHRWGRAPAGYEWRAMMDVGGFLEQLQQLPYPHPNSKKKSYRG
jgi:hypothetical protein